MEVVKDYSRLFPRVLEKAYERSKRFRKVGDIMSGNVVTITPDTKMDEAARVMGEKHIGSLIVEDNGKAVGIVTERDLMSRILAKRQDPKNVMVRRVMSCPLISIDPSATIKEVAQTMMRKKGRLVVFDSGEMVGIITASDLVRSLPDVPETALKVDDFMTKRVITANEKTTVHTVAKTMGDKRIGSVVVTSEGEPIGIFTERDLLTAFLEREEPLNVQVGDACSSPLTVIPLGTTIHETAIIMTSRRIKRLPISDDSELVGIITARDLVEAYSK